MRRSKGRDRSANKREHLDDILKSVTFSEEALSKMGTVPRFEEKAKYADNLIGCIQCALHLHLRWKKLPSFGTQSDESQDEGIVIPPFLYQKSPFVPRHTECNRPLEMVCATLQYLNRGKSQPIFLERDKNYGQLVSDLDETIYGQRVDLFKEFLWMIYAPKRLRRKEEELQYFGEQDMQFILERLRGNDFFKCGLRDLLQTGEEISFESFERFAESLQDVNENTVGQFSMCRNYLIGLYPDKYREEYTDFIIGLLSRLTVSNEKDKGYVFCSESLNVFENLIGSDTTGSCTLGPGGYNYHVAMQQQIDPHMGLMRCIDLGEASPRQAHAVAYIVECSENYRPVWLVDGVDLGYSFKGIEHHFSDLFFDAIVNAAREAPLEPKKVLFNKNVKNSGNRLFIKRIGKRGNHKEVPLEKIGGVDALSECESYVSSVWNPYTGTVEGMSGVSKKRAKQKPQLMKKHYLEAYHYETGSVWYPGGPFVANVVEVDI